ncbi:hypothetical protein E3O06_00735 [Cryobacterium glaciale]|uniref:Uncharacterized protein n=1 Tax=Cryobacterium glaciale TaxID=1259145 RepID=A0A4R8V5S7_9MICO|nr:cytochrome b/b6 domain-containing protein [Cryobacterium glaciale]TFB77314.1 hypothetical protein E3O06_00735 [Cryobacterium glaciale]
MTATAESTSRSPLGTSNRWRKLIWMVPTAVVIVAVVILVAKGLRELPAVQSFLVDFPGETDLPATAPVGFPAWLAWQHFLNSLFLLLIIRSGWRVRTVRRPEAFWTRRNTGIFRTRNAPKKISIDLWLHLSLDALWIANGVVFYVLLFATGQWMRVVPLTWEVFPNAVSALLHYASLNWPTESGWVNYNSLQVLAYFTTIFIAAPLAIITGLRMSGAWPQKARRLNALYPIEIARAIHLPVMFYFVLFIVAHVTLVATTGVLHNLNNMYAVNNGESWLGFGIFAASAVVMVIAWVAARPLLLRPIAALTGTVSR